MSVRLNYIEGVQSTKAQTQTNELFVAEMKCVDPFRACGSVLITMFV